MHQMSHAPLVVKVVGGSIACGLVCLGLVLAIFT